MTPHRRSGPSQKPPGSRKSRARPAETKRAQQQCIYETNCLPGSPGCLHYTARAPPASTNKHAAARRTPPTCNFFLQVAAACPVSMFQNGTHFPPALHALRAPFQAVQKMHKLPPLTRARTYATHAATQNTITPPAAPPPRFLPRQNAETAATSTPYRPARCMQMHCKCNANARRFCMQMHCKKCITRPREEIQKKID